LVPAESTVMVTGSSVFLQSVGIYVLLM